MDRNRVDVGWNRVERWISGMISATPNGSRCYADCWINCYHLSRYIVGRMRDDRSYRQAPCPCLFRVRIHRWETI